MAGAEAAVQHVVCERPQVSNRLIKGSKFLKWPKADGDDSSFVPVTLRVDPKGFILYWQEPSKDAECIEISSIRDTRFGRYAKEPKQEKYERAIQTYLDPQQYQALHSSDTKLHEICFTIVCGCRLVDWNFYNFVAVESNPRDVVTEWADLLLKLAYHPTTRNISLQTGYEKAYCKLKHETDQMGKIPVSKVVRLIGHKSKVVDALSSIGIIASKKDSGIDPDNFMFPQFRKLLQLCTSRPEVDNVFSQLGTGARRMYINHEKMKSFINTTQRDPSINNLLYPVLNQDQALELILQHEPNVMFANKGKLTQEGFDSYLMSDHNLMVGMDAYTLDHELVFPLSHYFVNSSHNTYLTGTQLKSKSSAEMYRQVLLTGCRCVELDCWDREEEPAITHGFTFCTDVPFRDVIEAINESAFKTSPFPVILSFENHVDVPEQQALMAKYCREIFGDKLLIDPLDQYPLTAGTPLPSPKELMYKIIIKNKKQRTPPQQQQKERRKPSNQDDTATIDRRRSNQQKTSSDNQNADDSAAPPNGSATTGGPRRKSVQPSIEEVSSVNRNKDDKTQKKGQPTAETSDNNNTTTTTIAETDETQEEGATAPSSGEAGDVTKSDDASTKEEEGGGEGASGNNAKDEDEYEEEEDDEEGQLTTTDYEIHAKDSGTASKESKASEFMSQLVNYIQPVRFKSFENSQRRNHSYEISSFTETTALKLLADDPVAFVNYNQRQMSRIYPKGARVESSNYMPQGFWNAGCQFVALNFQVLDLPMQLNMAKFEFNGGCGFLPKPSLMRYKDKQFDPFAERIDGVVAKSLSIKILSGQFLSSSKLSTYVEVDMFGLPSDTHRKRFRTRTIESNALNPQYNSPIYQFENIILPDLALLRIAVVDTSNNLVGQRFFPVKHIKPGYRYITLHNEGNQAMMMQSLFIYVEVEDYVSKENINLINSLVNPIEFLAEKDRKERELNNRMNALRTLLEPDELNQLIDPDGSNEVEIDGSDVKPHPLAGAAAASSANGNVGTKMNSGNGNGGKKNQQAQQQARTAAAGGGRVMGANQAKNSRSGDVMTSPSNNSNAPPEVQMESFTPKTVDDMKLGKAYLKLAKEGDKAAKHYRDKQRESFSKFYYQLTPYERPKSALKRFFGIKSPQPATNGEKNEEEEEERRDKLLDFVKRQLDDEKEFRCNQTAMIMERFQQIVAITQRDELEDLAKQCRREELECQRRKDKEKELLIQKIPVNVEKTEMEKRKAEITQTHIQQCVQERVSLNSKQQDRKKEVEETQKKIFASLQEESAQRYEKIELQHDEACDDLEAALDARVQDLKAKKNKASASGAAEQQNNDDDEASPVVEQPGEEREKETTTPL